MYLLGFTLNAGSKVCCSVWYGLEHIVCALSTALAESGHWGQNDVVWMPSAPQEALGSCLAYVSVLMQCARSTSIPGTFRASLIVGVTLRQWFWKLQAGKTGDARRDSS